LKRQLQLEFPSSAYDPIWGQAVNIASDLIRELFGPLGFQEFLIDDINYLPQQEIWRVRLTRKVEEVNLKYEITIDNRTGRPARFRKLP